MALLGATALAKAGLRRTRISVVTPEQTPLELFGRRAGEQMSRLLEERGIEVITGICSVRFDAGRLRITPGRWRPKPMP